MDIIPLARAVLCLDCDVITDRRFPRCPACASGALMALGKWLGRLESAASNAAPAETAR